MPAAPLPPNESVRLQSLADYQIVDSLPEQEYDDIVGIAARICRTPIALVSLIDADRQWFKARVGVDVAQTDRSAAFCAHAILHQDEVLAVRDATQDPRFLDNPLVTGAPHIRFYAGSPLVTPQGIALGTLCVIDSIPRELSGEQLMSLKALGRQTTSLIELRGRTNQLEKYRSELERSNEALQEFAYAASHDLKQPIRGIGSLTEFFVEDYGDQLDDSAKEKLELIRRLTDRAQTMIDQMLYYARVGSVVDRLQPVDLNEVVDQVKENLFALIASGQVTIQSRQLPSVSGEPVLLNELFQNLISNGIKYNDNESKTVEVGFQTKRIGDEDEPVTAFFVADNGIGIPKRMRPEVFTIFRRLHAADAYGGGSGAGLTIARKIVETHGGRIWIDPAYQGGTCFWFTIGSSAAGIENEFRHDNIRSERDVCHAIGI
ncbi:Phytochrome-like protein cph1 [Stieleria neptunia]|uniref:histidine kinase n=1 Tax=Stieleria neptunia TaxID=2527979 RepID=A0A518HUQ9_9BACT|nr:ATP-binding protein [Stieleria neptunia]QDV44592.1 Phytochrome-like protein cph1 [Stieleria neptunia]